MSYCGLFGKKCTFLFFKNDVENVNGHKLLFILVTLRRASSSFFLFEDYNREQFMLTAFGNIDGQLDHKT